MEEQGSSSDEDESVNAAGAADDKADDEAEAEELDEAGSSLQDYQRGKRLKKLLRILSSPQVT